MEQKLQSIIPQGNDSVHQYALIDQEGKRDPSKIGSVLQRNSISVLQTFARNSLPGHEPALPTALNSAYARQFSRK